MVIILEASRFSEHLLRYGKLFQSLGLKVFHLLFLREAVSKFRSKSFPSTLFIGDLVKLRNNHMHFMFFKERPVGYLQFRKVSHKAGVLFIDSL